MIKYRICLINKLLKRQIKKPLLIDKKAAAYFKPLELKSFFLNPGFFACKVTEIENPCSPDSSMFVNFNLIDKG